ncbi:membrane-associated transporter protein-like [Ptychodera flava]|uniref:membrane-associated transporter protein-like n=1 Tax=Ptychodera flava TaxID=63121 RepID=UPI003969FC25
METDDEDDFAVSRPLLERSVSNPEGSFEERSSRPRTLHIPGDKRNKRKHSLSISIAHKSVKNAVLRPKTPSGEFKLPVLAPRGRERRARSLDRKRRCKSLDRDPGLSRGPSRPPHGERSPRTPTISEQEDDSSVVVEQSDRDVGDDDASSESDDDDDDEPPKRSLCQLLRNNAIAFGIEVCYATETALVMPILLKIGLPNELYSLTWLVSPILGFICQPLIGSMSDRCTCFWGQRRPFILGLCIGALVGLTLLLNGDDIGKAATGTDGDNVAGIVLTVAGVIILDFCADSSDGPSRAYMIDVCNSDDLEKGLNLHAMFGGLGGGIGYIMTGVDWEDTEIGKLVGGHLRVVYIFNFAVFLFTFMLTLCSIEEEPLKLGSKDELEVKVEDSKSLAGQNRDKSCHGNCNEIPNALPPALSVQVPVRNSPHEHLRSQSYGSCLSSPSSPSLYMTDSESDDGFKDVAERSFARPVTSSDFDTTVSPNVVQAVANIETSVTSMERSVKLIENKVTDLERSVRSLQDFAAVKTTSPESESDRNSETRRSSSSLSSDEPASAFELIKSIVVMPGALRRLCINHFMGWFSFVSVLLFFTDYVGQVVYHGDPKASLNNTDRIQYDEGVKMGCWGLCIYAFSAAIYSLIFDRLLNCISQRTAYVAGQLLYAIALGMMAIFNNNIYVVLGMCPFFGVMFTTITTLPFAIVAEFHDSDAYVYSTGNGARGLGTDISSLSCQIFLAQILVSAILGLVIKATGTHLVIVLFGSGAAFIAAICSAVVVVYEIPDPPDEKQPLLENQDPEA